MDRYPLENTKNAMKFMKDKLSVIKIVINFPTDQYVHNFCEIFGLGYLTSFVYQFISDDMD